MHRYILSLIFLGISLVQAQPPTLIKNVHIVDVRSGEILENKSVFILGEIITSITDKPPRVVGAQIINGRGRFLVPGLAEMHAHIPTPNWGRKNVESTLFLYLSQGVTTIRGMLGHPSHLELREKAAYNEIVSPRIYAASPPLNGKTVTTAEEAREKVNAYEQDGYDFLKILPGIELPVFDALVAQANEVGIAFAGHVPADVGIRHALNSGYATIDHVDGFLEGLVSEQDKIKVEDGGFFGYNYTLMADESKIDELVRLASKQEVWVVPTQTLFERWFSPEPASFFLAQPEMQYMPPDILESWEKSKNNFLSDPAFSKTQWQAFNSIRRKLIKRLHENGHGLLLGSDAPQVFNVPGFSIHHEIETMLEAGLSALEVLQIGTINPAKYLEAEDEFGQIKEGYSADMILVKSNPLEDISTLSKPELVIARGMVLNKKTIAKRLKDIAKEQE